MLNLDKKKSGSNKHKNKNQINLKTSKEQTICIPNIKKHNNYYKKKIA